MADAESSIRGMLGCQTQEEVVRILSFFHYLQVFAIFSKVYSEFRLTAQTFTWHLNMTPKVTFKTLY